MSTQSGTTKNDTLTFVTGDTDINGLAGTDTLLFKQTDADLSSTLLVSIEILKADAANGASTVFTVDTKTNPNNDLGSVTKVLGNKAFTADELQTTSSTLTLTSIALTSIEVLSTTFANGTNGTTFTVDQADLAKGGSVNGSTGIDTLTTNGVKLDLSSTTLTAVEILKAGSAKNTTFTIGDSALGSLTDIKGNTGTDTVTSKSANFDLSGITLSSIEILKSTGKNVLITTDDSVGTLQQVVGGSSKTDTLFIDDAGPVTLANTKVTGIETIQGDGATVLTVDQADLAKNGSLTDLGALLGTGTGLNLTSTTLTSVDELRFANTNAFTFTVDTADLAEIDAIGGKSTTNSHFVVTSSTIDLTGVEITKAEVHSSITNKAVNFTVDSTTFKDTALLTGTAQTNDSVTTSDTGLDLSSGTLSLIEILKAGTTDDTTFTVNQADLTALGANGQIQGNTGDDTLALASTESLLNLASTTLSSVEILKTNKDDAAIRVDQGDLAAGGSIEMNTTGADVDAVIANGASLNLTGTTLTGVDRIEAGSVAATTFTVSQAVLDALGVDSGTGGTIKGSVGADTIVAVGDLDFVSSSTTLTSIEKLQADTTNGTEFTLNATQLAGLTSITGGNSGSTTDTLVVDDTTIDLSNVSVTGIDELKAGANADTDFIVDQADLNGIGAISGATGKDNSIGTAGTGLDISAATTTEIQTLTTTNATGTKFVIDLDVNGDIDTVTGSGGADELVVLSSGGSTLDLSGITLTDVEKVSTTQTGGVLFKFDASADVAGLTIVGASGNSTLDSLTINSTNFDLSSTSLSSIEALVATKDDTTFTLGNDDLVSGGSITANGGASTNDIVQADGASLDLSNTTLSGIEHVKAAAGGTSITVTQAQLGGSFDIAGGAGTDSLTVTGDDVNLTSVALTDIEILATDNEDDTLITVDKNDLVSGTGDIEEIHGGASTEDTLTVTGTAFDLTSVTLSSVEILKSDADNTTFTLSQDAVDDLEEIQATGDSGDIIQAVGSELDLSDITLTDIEAVKADNATGTDFTFTSAQFNSGISIQGGGATDGLVIAGEDDVNLTTTTLSSIEKIGTDQDNTTFTVLASQLGGSGITQIQGSGDNGDKLIVKGNSTVNLASTTLTEIEQLSSDKNNTTFIVNTGAVSDGLEILGKTGISSTKDTVQAGGASLDLTSTTLTSIEILKSHANGSNLELTQDQINTDLQIVGATGKNDTLTILGTSYDLTLRSITSIEILATDNPGSGSGGTVFTVDQADLAKNGSVTGSAHDDDVLIVTETEVDLTSTTLTSIEELRVSSTEDTTFTLDQNKNLASLSSISGDSGVDTVIVTGASADFSNITLENIDVLKAGQSGGFTFILGQDDLLAGGSVVGVAGTGSVDTVATNDAALNLSSTTLSSIEILLGSSTAGTTFTLSQSNVNSLGTSGEVNGNGQSATISAAGNLDISSLTLTSVDTLSVATTTNTTLTVSEAELAQILTFNGNAGTADVLAVHGTNIDISFQTFSDIENLKAADDTDNTITVGGSGFGSFTSITGGAGFDTVLATSGSSLDLSSVTLTNVDILKNGTGGNFTFIVDAGDLASGGTVVGDAGFTDTLQAAGALLDLRNRDLVSVEVLSTGYASGTSGTNFQIDQADLTGGVTEVDGSSGTDTLTVSGAALDLTGTTISSIEVLATSQTAATKFTVDQADINSAITIKGTAQTTDILQVNGSNGGDLTKVTLSGVETIQSDTPASGDAWTVGAGLGSATIALGANASTDTIAFTGDYHAVPTSLSTLNANMVSIKNFETGTDDVIDISGLVHGGTSNAQFLDITGSLGILGPSPTLLQAANLAAIADASGTSLVRTFVLNSETYLVIDNSASDKLTASDQIIHLVGTVTLDANDNIAYT